MSKSPDKPSSADNSAPNTNSSGKQSRRRFLETLGVLTVGAVAENKLHILGSFASQKVPVSESLEHTLRQHGIDDYTIIDETMAPEKYKVFKDAYTKLTALLSKGDQANLKQPVVVAFTSDEKNAYHIATINSLREREILAISEQEYTNATKDELLYNYGHELGHWLILRNRSAAEEISGFNSPEVQPILKKLKARIEALGKGRTYTTEHYQEACDELIADGIAMRISATPTAAVTDLKNTLAIDDSLTANMLLNKYDMVPKEKDSLSRQINAILQKRDQDGITDHPANDIRAEYMQCVAKLFGHTLPGKVR